MDAMANSEQGVVSTCVRRYNLIHRNSPTEKQKKEIAFHYFIVQNWDHYVDPKGTQENYGTTQWVYNNFSREQSETNTNNRQRVNDPVDQQLSAVGNYQSEVGGQLSADGVNCQQLEVNR
jgi:hypothetical protein|uniref:Uncharacterized protein n=1 Tax=Eutreptiella gymnastica TaxID=73025 RepID=A0A7S4FY86_9EUGL